MPRGRESERAKLPRESILKVDKDCHVNSDLEHEYVQDALMMLRMHNVQVGLIQATRTQHGRHYYFHIEPSVDAQTANSLQYLLGDDPKRVDFNQARINSALDEWNKLFERAGVKARKIYVNHKRDSF